MRRGLEEGCQRKQTGVSEATHETRNRSIRAMIRIRPGRSWRHNPGYVGKLRRLEGRHLHGFEGSGILDVLGIEVDGVDIAAGGGEAEVLVGMDRLARRSSRVRAGGRAAQATVGGGPPEFVWKRADRTCSSL